MYRWYLHDHVGDTVDARHPLNAKRLLWGAYERILHELYDAFEDGEKFLDGFRYANLISFLQNLPFPPPPPPPFVSCQTAIAAHVNRFMGFKDVQFTNGRKVLGAPVYACFFVFLAGKCGMGYGLDADMKRMHRPSTVFFVSWCVPTCVSKRYMLF